jgi:hypothetical protein
MQTQPQGTVEAFDVSIPTNGGHARRSSPPSGSPGTCTSDSPEGRARDDLRSIRSIHLMNHTTFADRSEAGWMLVERLRGERFHDPLVLAIPRGGIEVGAALARGLGAQLDVVLSRKLRAPHQPELALGAVSEDGSVHLNHFAAAMTDAGDAWIEAERRRQLAEIDRRSSVGAGFLPAPRSASITAGRKPAATVEELAALPTPSRESPWA